jgi:predicted lipoprotein with Yx(FWY)xxD motif/plastocyanin
MRIKMRTTGLLAIVLGFGMSLAPFGAWAAAEQTTAGSSPPASAANWSFTASHASEVAAQMGVLLGDADGVTDEYLAKTTTRLQGAIMTLRLLGKEHEAQTYTGTDNFADADSVGSSIRPVLAYLKNHPELGWNGSGGGKFAPNQPITAQQVYKVMLESLSYHTGTDFQYADTLTFAASKGLNRAAEAVPFTNRHLAAALIETLQSSPDGMKPLVESLVAKNVVSADKAALVAGARIDLRKTADGSLYFTDGKGMALYLYTKDMADLNTCVGQCLSAWPVFGADHLLLADGLDSKDFGAFVRTDGLKQITFKGWPLYYWVKDLKPGDVSGEGVGKVWYLIKQPFYTVTLGTDPKLGSHLVDKNGMSLYYFDKDPKGSSVCTGDCLKNWPAFHADTPVVPSGLKAEDFGEMTRSNGTKQTTFKGYPLYYWIKDMKRGDVTGQDIGKVWFVVNPETFAGTTAEKTAPGPTTTTTVPTAATKVTIEMKNYSFSKTDVTVKAGTTIEFVNRDDDKHNAVATDGSFKIALLGKGESATIQLDKPGTYEFYCEPHKDHMKGKITVQ